MTEDERTARIQQLTPRYDLATNYRCGSSIEEMERNDEDGEWLRWEDALAMCDRIRLEHEAWDKARVKEIEELRRRLQVFFDWEGANENRLR